MDVNQTPELSARVGNKRVTLTIELNLAALLGRINRKLEETSRFVSMALATEADDQVKESAAFSIQFNSGLDWSPEQRKEAWQSWVLRNAFRDVAELISGVLEEAHQVLSVLALLDKQRRGEVVKGSDHGKLREVAKRFHRLSLADKLTWLSAQQDFNLSSEKMEEIISINVARNCLGHRAGVVGDRDITEDDKLVVRWLGLDMMIATDGVEIPLVLPMYVEKGGTAILRAVRRIRGYSRGDVISFDGKDFSEIAWTVFAFSQAVTTALEQAAMARGISFQRSNTDKPTGSGGV